MGDSMSCIINASNSSGLTFSSDLSGSIQLQQNGVNLPALSVAPAFSAYASSNQTISTSTYTKITFDTEEFDTNNNFASSRFTPTVSGYYQINAYINFGSGGTSRAIVQIYKNGSNVKQITDTQATSANQTGGSALIYMNGSTDYLEIYGWSGSQGTLGSGSTQTYFQGFLARGA